MRDPVGLWIFARDMRRAKNDVPQKEHVSKVALVVADTIIGCVGMMGMMRGGRRDQPLQHPGNRMKNLVLIEGFVPGNAGMRQSRDYALQAKNNQCRTTQTHIHKSRGQINLRKENRVDHILAARHSHTHISGRVVSAVESPQPRNLVMQTVIPVLGQVVGHADDEYSPKERNPGEMVLQAGQNNGQNPQAEISDNRPYDDVGRCETGNIRGPFILGPPPFVQPERELQYPQNKHEESEGVVVEGAESLFKGLIVVQQWNRSVRCLLPRSLAGEIKRKKHERDRQRIDQHTGQSVADDPFPNFGIHFHKTPSDYLACEETCSVADLLVSALRVRCMPPSRIRRGTAVATRPTTIFFANSVMSCNRMSSILVAS